MSVSTETRRSVGIAIGLAAVVAALLSLFAWPATNSAPRHLAIAVSGPTQATDRIQAALDKQQPGAFDITRTSDDAAAADRVREHKAYGALVVQSDGLEVLTASARSATVAQLIDQVGTEVGTASNLQVRSSDIVPAPSSDPRGAGIGVSMLPVAIGGILGASACTFLIRRRRDRAITITGYAVLAGLGTGAVLQFWLGTIEGDYWVNSGVLALGIGAVAMTLLGLESLLGNAGIGLGAFLMMIVGNALSAASSAPEMLPTGWGAVGQLLPLGATNTALRAVAFFDGWGSLKPLVVMASWLVFGLALQALAAWRRRRAGRLHADDTSATTTDTTRGAQLHPVS